MTLLEVDKESATNSAAEASGPFSLSLTGPVSAWLYLQEQCSVVKEGHFCMANLLPE